MTAMAASRMDGPVPGPLRSPRPARVLTYATNLTGPAAYINQELRGEWHPDPLDIRVFTNLGEATRSPILAIRGHSGAFHRF